MLFRLIGPISIGLVMIATASLAHDTRPLGDDKLSQSPKRGFLYACRPANPNAPGAQRVGPWINGNNVDMAAKIAVQGAVSWPDAAFDVTVSQATREIDANNLPLHHTGYFPIRRDDPAYQYDRNPNEIRAQRFAAVLPLEPRPAPQPSCVPMGIVGFTLNNVVLFNAVDARGQDAAAHELLDSCGGHPARRGVYHYHDRSPCLSDEREASGHSVLVGYAIDGFGIYGAHETAGDVEITNAELDECHGHVGPVEWNGRVTEVYHYHLNDEFPFSIGCLRGVPISMH